MYDLTILSIFRQSENYINRYLQQLTESFEINGGKCHAVWLEGDSTDKTYQILQEAKHRLEATQRIDVTLIKFDHGGPHWPGIINTQRWHQLATCWNNCLAGLKPSKFTVCVESDLIYNPAIISKLIEKIDERHHVIYPMLMLYDGSFETTPELEWFYDIWGMRREGVRFNHYPPYWLPSDTLIEEDDLLELTLGGGMIVTTYNYQKLGKFDPSCCIMTYPPDVKLFMHKKLKIYHPVPGDSRYWTPAILLSDWERSQFQVRQTRSERDWYKSQAEGWKHTAHQALIELEQVRLELQQAQQNLIKIKNQD